MKNIAKDGILFLIFGTALLIYSLVNHYSANIIWSLSPYLFPLVISLFFIFLAVGLLLGSRQDLQQNPQGNQRQGMQQKPQGKQREDMQQNPQENAHSSACKICWKPVLIFLAIVFVYYIIMPFAGFIVSNVILLACLFILLGLRIWWKIACLSVVTTLTIYYFFHSFLHVMLP